MKRWSSYTRWSSKIYRKYGIKYGNYKCIWKSDAVTVAQSSAHGANEQDRCALLGKGAEFKREAMQRTYLIVDERSIVYDPRAVEKAC